MDLDHFLVFYVELVNQNQRITTLTELRTRTCVYSSEIPVDNELKENWGKSLIK